MKIRRFAPLFRFASGVCLLATLSACSLFHRHHRDAESTARTETRPPKHATNARGPEMEIKVSPDPLKLGEVREVAVNIVVRNNTKEPVTLKFPTTQILDITLRDVVTGSVVSKWSTDRTFNEDSRLVTINRGEHLEYNETITTRELKPGKIYNLEVYFLGHENELSAKKVLIPQP